MAYRSRLQRIQEKRNFRQAVGMFVLGIGIVLVLAFYGVKGMAALAILIDRAKFGNNVNYAVDKIPPAPPTIWADFTATNSARVKIYGISEPETNVQLLQADRKLLEQGSDSEGKLVFENVLLAFGKNEFTALAFDKAGNKSHTSRILVIAFSDKNPDLNVEKPAEEQKFGGRDNPIEIKGTTLAGVKVYINGRLTITDGNGGFMMKLNLNEGENILKIKAVDLAGNETNKEIKVFYQP